MSASNNDKISFMDQEVAGCPYAAYQQLRENEPVFYDDKAGCYVITRYDDVRSILMDPHTFGSQGYLKKVRERVQADRADRMLSLYEQKGWVPAPALGFIDDPRHREVRQIFDRAFRPTRLKELDPVIRDIAYELAAPLAQRGYCDVVADYAVHLPLRVTGVLTCVPDEDLEKIRIWTEAFIRRIGFMVSEEEETKCVEMEIEAQHYLKKIIDRLRIQPDESLLSDIVNTPMSDGSTLSDNELFAHLMADTFVGGSETTTSALASCARLMCESKEVYDRLKSDPDTQIPLFIEEVLRLESPVQGLFRVANKDVEMHGVVIPEGSILNIRYAAANRDQRQFELPETLDMDRKKVRSHIAFGIGIHHCPGSPLARRELFWGLKAILDSFDNIELAEGKNDFSYAPSFMLWRLNQLHITYDCGSN